ncbi:MAG: peptidoglycan-binding protein [Tissierellia bacterium]|nr:peptidoglycan-binding protein [Tissierellia bacterium]
MSSNLIDSSIILELQNYLINIRNSLISIPPVYPTGIYDNNTRNAVAEFQKLMDLPPSGVVDINTWNALVKENEKYLRRTRKPSRIPVSNSEFEDIKIGAKRDIVYAIRIMLNSYHRRYANYKKLEITDIYSEDVEEAIKLFQERTMLPVTGVVDKDTWDSLVTIYDTCGFYK